MKKLHLIAGKDIFRPAQQYIQVKNGFAYVTDSHTAIKAEITEVMPELLEDMPTEYYIKATDWQSMVKVNPLFMERENGYIKAVGRKNRFICSFMTLTEFTEKIGRYPDVNSVLPSVPDMSENTVHSFGISPELLYNLSEAMGGGSVCVISKGDTKISFVYPIVHGEPKIFGVIMPIYIGQDKKDDIKNTINNLISAK
jgi:hypothetical protein